MGAKMNNNLEPMRHTLSHILAAAVKELYPDVKFGIGPAIANGFYYDIDFGKTKISDTSLAKIEKKMREIIKQNLKVTKHASTKEEALKWAKDNKQDYKVELIEELPDNDEITFYDVYKAVDCVGGEGLFRFHENPNPDCPVGKNIHMALDGKLMDVQRSMENELRRISIADVAVQLKEEIESRKEA